MRINGYIVYSITGKVPVSWEDPIRGYSIYHTKKIAQERIPHGYESQFVVIPASLVVSLKKYSKKAHDIATIKNQIKNLKTKLEELETVEL